MKELVPKLIEPHAKHMKCVTLFSQIQYVLEQLYTTVFTYWYILVTTKVNVGRLGEESPKSCLMVAVQVQY